MKLTGGHARIRTANFLSVIRLDVLPITLHDCAFRAMGVSAALDLTTLVQVCTVPDI